MKTVSLVLLCAALGGAQPPRPASVQASATASVSVAPDQARIQIGVVSQAQTASAAAAQNASLLQTALDRLKAAAGPKAEVKTVSYSVSPNYDFSKGAHTLKGFTASNMVQVTTDDLASVGKIIDAATQSGANEVSSLEFTLRDHSQARAQALRKAALQARGEAEAMASALGLKVGKVIYLDAGGGEPPIRPRAFAAAQTMAMPTPIEQPQAIEVQATVTITIALEQ
jgi:uncharacterized protein YggE